MAQQIALLLAVSEGLLDGVDLKHFGPVSSAIKAAVAELPAAEEIARGQSLDGARREAVLDAVRAALDEVQDGHA